MTEPVGDTTHRGAFVVAPYEEDLVGISKLEREQVQDHLTRELPAICAQEPREAWSPRADNLTAAVAVHHSLR